MIKNFRCDYVCTARPPRPDPAAAPRPPGPARPACPPARARPPRPSRLPCACPPTLLWRIIPTQDRPRPRLAAVETASYGRTARPAAPQAALLSAGPLHSRKLTAKSPAGACARRSAEICFSSVPCARFGASARRAGHVGRPPTPPRARPAPPATLLLLFFSQCHSCLCV